MEDQENSNSIPPIEVSRTVGSPITGRHKDKSERIREAMDDLELVIEGSITQLTPDTKPLQFSAAVGALARSCSIFLRKLVLGDRNNKATRLFDDEVCDAMGLKFHRLVRITGGRIPMKFEFGFDRGRINFTKKNEETYEPEWTDKVPVGQHKVAITVEFPLPGMAFWDIQPDHRHFGSIRVEELFDLDSEPSLSCDAWLGQQVVLLDGDGITLKEVVRMIANTEGAHSASGTRKNKNVDYNDNKAVQRYRLDMLNNMTFANIKFSHIVTIESALYLYYILLDYRHKQGEIDGIYLPVIQVVCDAPSKVTSSGQGFLGFEGGMMINFGVQEQVILHAVKATR